MQLHDFASDVLFVIVLYKRRHDQAAACTSFGRLRSLLPDLSLFIYDNSAEPFYIKDEHVIYRHAGHNHGVARAYNEAFSVAETQQKHWMILFDQDTVFGMELLEHLHRSVKLHGETRCFVPKLRDADGLFSPFRWKAGKGRRIRSAAEKLSLEKFRFANSGLLISTHAYREAGGYDENIPLDFSDISFGEKLRAITDHFIVVPTVLIHDSSATKHMMLSEAADRFLFYCRGAFQMGKTYGPRLRCYFWALIRSVLLSIRYRNARFLKIFITTA